jgi:hypothetical protein
VYQHVPHSTKSRVSTANKLKHKYICSVKDKYVNKIYNLFNFGFTISGDKGV